MRCRCRIRAVTSFREFISTGSLRFKNTLGIQCPNAAASGATTLLSMDASDIVLVGSNLLRTNIRTSEGVYTAGAPTLDGKVTYVPYVAPVVDEEAAPLE